MGKNKEEFMKDREQEASLNYVYKIFNLEGELEEKKHLLSKCKTLISDIFIEDYHDVRRQKEELLTELKEY